MEIRNSSLEEALKYLNNKIAYVYSERTFIIFNNGMVTYVPENLLPESTIDSIIYQLKKTKVNTVNVASQQPEQLEGIKTKDEVRIQELKNQGVKLRRSKAECCGDPKELELYTLSNTVRKRRNRAMKKPKENIITNSSQNPVPQYLPMNTVTTIHSEVPIIEKPKLELEILPCNHQEKAINYCNQEREPQNISRITEILTTKEEPKRSITRRLVPREQLDIIEFVNQMDKPNIPWGTVDKFTELYDKLRKDDGTGLRLALRDEELLKDLETKLKRCKII